MFTAKLIFERSATKAAQFKWKLNEMKKLTTPTAATGEIRKEIRVNQHLLGQFRSYFYCHKPKIDLPKFSPLTNARGESVMNSKIAELKRGREQAQPDAA